VFFFTVNDYRFQDLDLDLNDYRFQDLDLDLNVFLYPFFIF